MAESFKAARSIILDNVAPLESESVDLLALVGRVLAEEVPAPWDMPRWDNSEMDGFAVRSTDCQPFSRLKVDGYLPAGSSADDVSVKSGTVVRIMTGAPIPRGCDAIVPIENTEPGKEFVVVKKLVQVGDYIRFRGSDIGKDEVLLPAGTVLRPADINLLAAFSRTAVQVCRCPEVAILSTGDELVAPGEITGPGQIIDSNAYSLAAAIREIGAIPKILGIAQDNRESLEEKIGQGLKADVLITSAGVSTGDRDLVREILESAGVKRLFWKVAIKPGGPTAFGLKEGIAVFSLPGNPVSSMIGFEMLVRPALLKMMGHSEVIRPQVKATLKAPLYNETSKTRFLRVKVEQTSEGLLAESAGDQNTGILSTMIRANAIAVLSAEQTELSAGEQVDVQLLDSC
ncbi:MAG: gephyrin-like molybdotransferase Glp [Thermodesulfobacteriota bacterium]|nr:gephyrin-like molybdotransferase Glp [Thermodesulfobacteriota bacterium]